MEVKATRPKFEQEATVNVDFKATVAEKVEWTSEQIVNDAVEDSWVITLQSAMRRWLEAGKSEVEIQTLASEWKPGVTVRGAVDPIQSTLGKFAKMSTEEQEAFMEALKARLAAKG
jgi:hypothetical protein